MKKIEVNITKEEFERLYYDENLTQGEIAERLGVTINPIIRLMKEYDIVRRDPKDASKIAHQTMIRGGKNTELPFSQEELIDMYINKNMCPAHIGRLYNIDKAVIARAVSKLPYTKDEKTVQSSVESYIKTFNITVGGKKGKKYGHYKNKGQHRVEIDIDELTHLIKDTDYTLNEIAKHFHVHSTTIAARQKEYNIKLSPEDKREHINRLFYQRYGISDDIKNILISESEFRKFIIDNNLNTVPEIARSLNLANSTICRYVNDYHLRDIVKPYSANSDGERELQNFLESIGVIARKDHCEIKPQEIDLYCPDYNIGIEYNGDYWHSDIKKTKNYHFDKSRICDNSGIRLIHIYEHEWKDPQRRRIIESFLKITFRKISDKIYARNCEIRKISNKEAKIFNNNNHLQGHRNAQVTYGLYYHNELVQLMSFSYDKKHDWWEIIRGCPGSNNIVIGGVSRLFTHFLREYNPDKVFSYCDYNKFDGHGYEILGMKFIGYTGPNLSWLMPGGEVIPRSPSKHKILQETAVAKIWGAGSKKYLWTKDENKLEN